MIYPPVRSIQIHDRAGVQELFRALWSPARNAFVDQDASAREHAIGLSSRHNLSVMIFEAFARPLWGLIGYGSDSFEDWEDWQLIRRKIVEGTDPNHHSYWGTPVDFDHRFVDYPPVVLALYFCRRQLWDPLAEDERSQISRWFRRINDHQLHDNNWLWFRVSRIP